MKPYLLIPAFILCTLNGYSQTRTEKDLLGEKQIPAECLLWCTNRQGTGKFPG